MHSRMAGTDDKKRPTALNLTPQRTGTSSSSSSEEYLKGPRTPRFAEATSVHSPVNGKSPFADPEPSNMSHVAQAQPGDIGFGYINEGQRESITMPMTPRSPLKSAMKVPGTPARFINNPLSPTFREEDILEKREESTEKEQARDLKIKTRVRMAKFALRGVNFSCSLIVLSMLSSTLSIFNATKTLPKQSGMSAWAPNSKTWPQYLVLSMACISLFTCVLVFVGYCRGGHRRADKVSTYYTMFAIGWFIISMILWAVTAALYQHSKTSNNGKDMWSWACTQNARAVVYENRVDYQLICRLQNWSLICIIIEVVVEVMTISLYSVVFYRYYTKRRLHKSMDMRDRARSDLYLAQLRSQSAPNTPGFGPRTPGFGPKSPALSSYAMSPRHAPAGFGTLGKIGEEPSPFTPGGRMQMEEPQSRFGSPSQAGFKLQAPPVKAPSATPKMNQSTFQTTTTVVERSPSPPSDSGEAPRAANEPVYESVPIPGAYAGQAMKSPGPGQVQFGHAQ